MTSNLSPQYYSKWPGKINRVGLPPNPLYYYVFFTYLGKKRMDEMITGFYQHAKSLEAGLKAKGFRIINEVVFNQVLIACENEELTKTTLAQVQSDGVCWCGGSSWDKKSVIRISICSWATTTEDIEKTIAAFHKAHLQAKGLGG